MIEMSKKMLEKIKRDVWNEAIEIVIKRINELDDWFPIKEIRKLKK